MTEMVTVMRAEDYFETYGRNGIGKGYDREMVKRQMLDTFRKEIFGLVAMRAKKNFDDIPPEGDPEAIRIARNVIRDETKKWIKICRIFDTYRETSGLIKYDDIALDEEDVLGGGRQGGIVATLVTDETMDGEPEADVNNEE